MRTALCVLFLLAACRSNASEHEPELRDEFQVVTLRHAAAPELADELNGLFDSERGPAAEARTLPKLIADTRTNSLLVKAEPADLARILRLVEKLDQEVGAKSR